MHVMNPYVYGGVLCGQYIDGYVASFDVQDNVDCMTCLVRANQPTFESRMAEALHLSEEFLFVRDEDDGVDH